ncbi:MAG: hypothetical protein HY535_06920 [Chloroflexi bacterium]|nr:hypothetical protein [Chloroflexota bacterium]
MPKRAALSRFALVLVLFLLLAVGCVRGPQVSLGETAEGGPVSKIEVLLGEYFFQMEDRAKGSPLVLQAGRKYEIEFVNMGSELHEVLLGRGLVRAGGKPARYQKSLLEGVPVEVEGKTVVGDKLRAFEVEAEGLEELELEPGVELEIEFTLPADRVGEWELACLVPGHYEAGMRLPVVVEGKR